MQKIGFHVKDTSYGLKQRCHWCSCVFKKLLSHLYMKIYFDLCLNVFVITTVTCTCTFRLNLALISVLPYIIQWSLKSSCKQTDAKLSHESKYTKFRFPHCYPTSRINPQHKLKAILSFYLLNSLQRTSVCSLVHGIWWFFFTLAA